MKLMKPQDSILNPLKPSEFGLISTPIGPIGSDGDGHGLDGAVA